MDSTEANYESPTCEGSEDLNGKDASFRNAGMISAPRLVIKRRVRGALVPIGRTE